MGLFKILRAAAVHNNKSAGGRGRGEGGEGKERGVRSVTDCLQKIDCQKMAGDAVKLKMPPTERKRQRGGRAREVPAPEECADGGIGETGRGKLPDLKPHCLGQGRHSLKPTPLTLEGCHTPLGACPGFHRSQAFE